MICIRKIDIDLLQMILVVNACVGEKLCPVRKMMARHFLGQGIVGCNGSLTVCTVAEKADIAS